jgi:hypothetical protein
MDMNKVNEESYETLQIRKEEELVELKHVLSLIRRAEANGAKVPRRNVHWSLDSIEQTMHEVQLFELFKERGLL